MTYVPLVKNNAHGSYIRVERALMFQDLAAAMV